MGIFNQLVVSSVVSLLYTEICAAIMSNELFHDSPMYSWWSCLPFQLFLLPCIALQGLLTQPRSFNKWMLAKWSDLNKRAPTEDGESSHLTPERIYLLVLHGYLFKDCFVGMDSQYWIHHVLCWTCIWSFLYVDTAPVFVIGSMILELGSATQTILFFNEASTIAKWLHVGGMTMSNVLAAYLVIFVYVKNGVGNLKVRIFLGITALVLMGARQKSCYENWSLFDAKMLAAV